MDSGSALLAHLGWQQFHGQNMQSAMMYSGMGNMMGAQGLMGGMMSQGAAMGAPMLGGLGGLLGLDPMSLGLKAGGLAWTKGGAGVLGAGMAGMGVMAGAGIVGAGAAWTGGQMLSGAQQQMGLSRGLAQNFNFMNTQGGQGFTANQSFRIGEDVRSMTHELGSGGEMASFSELSRLATNMGRMGMGQNVRTVRDFKEKFKQMVDSVKTIATELGTSLEEAQKMMASMRQVGIFKPGQSVAAAGQMRNMAMAGGLAMSEVSGMMNIGSQIARSVGGLGRQGAMGGMRAIGQIGTAVQLGALSEEDIYNATGLTGAEGRQAFATDMMSKSASFLRSGRGRRFLASVAGANGQVDQESMMEWMTGGVGTGRTMEMAHRNLAGIGRANFIRNEGRLRGSVLEQMPNAQAMVYKQWLQQRGFDPNNMDDRSMLAFQRFSGLGRDEAEAQLKIVDRLPEIMRQQSLTQGGMESADLLVRRSKTTGIEGFKRKMEHTRERIQGRLQQAGADILEEGTVQLAAWFNKVTGAYEEQANASVTSFVTAARGGGAMSSQMDLRSRRLFGGATGTGGLGAGGAVKYQSSLQSQMDAISRAKVTEGDQAYAQGASGDAFREWMTNKGAALQGEDRLAGMQQFLKKRAEGGSKEDIMAYERWRSSSPSERAAMAARLEQATGTASEVGIGVGMKDQFDKAMIAGSNQGGLRTQAERDEVLGKALLGDQQTGWGKAAAVATAGVLSVPAAIMGLGEATTNRISALFGGESLVTDSSSFKASTTWDLWKGAADSVGNLVSGSAKRHRQAGALLQDDATRANIAALASGKGEDLANAQRRLQVLRARKAKGELGEGTDATELMILNKAQAVDIVDKKLRGMGLKSLDQVTDPKVKEDLLNAVKDATGEDLTLDDVKRFKTTATAAMDEASIKAATQAAKEIQSSQRFEQGRYEKMGVAQYKKVRDEMKFIPTNAAGQQLMRDIDKAAAAAGAKTPAEIEEFKRGYKIDGLGTLEGMSPEELAKRGISREVSAVYGSEMELTAATRKKLDAAMSKAGGKGAVETGQEAARLAMAVNSAEPGKFLETVKKRDEYFASMTIAQKRAFARTFAGTDAGEAMAVSLAQQQRFEGLQKSAAQRGLKGEAGSLTAAAGMLGLDLDKDVARNLVGKGEKASADQIKKMLTSAGVKSDVLDSAAGKKFQDDVEKAMKMAREGKTGEAAALLGAAKTGAPAEIAKALEEAETKKAALQGDPTARVVDAVRESANTIAAAVREKNKKIDKS